MIFFTIYYIIYVENEGEVKEMEYNKRHAEVLPYAREISKLIKVELGTPDYTNKTCNGYTYKWLYADADASFLALQNHKEEIDRIVAKAEKERNLSLVVDMHIAKGYYGGIILSVLIDTKKSKLG